MNLYKTRTISCQSCGCVKTARMPEGRKFCSLSCYRKTPRPKKRTGKFIKCAICAEPTYITKSRLGKDRYFCCPEHANDWQGRNKVNLTCSICECNYKLSKSIANDKRRLSPSKYCSLKCRNKDPIFLEYLLKLNQLQQQGGMTKPEKIGYDLLERLNIDFIPQHLIGSKFCVDAFLPKFKVIVQFDGDYWHGNPKKFPQPSKRQLHRIRLDLSQDKYMKKCGFKVIRLWESTLLKDISSAEEAILQTIT